MFLKSAGAIVAEGENVKLPPGRTQIEWECELGVVIGKPASHVREANALDYVFGYTLENDMSDRGGRGDTRLAARTGSSRRTTTRLRRWGRSSRRRSS